jgi:tetratricopeptide (TPR) repeat protein/transcriptional regulator with XRE-family HTH domain
VFGQVVAAHRRRLSLTQEELAVRAGLSDRTIREIEAGRVAAPRAASVRALADAFGLAGRVREEFVAGTDPAVGPGASRPVPAQLPADVRGFAGRTGALQRLDAVLAAAVDTPTAVLISAVSGTAGVGKTALAIHWAHRVRDRFPDGQLYVNLRGFDADGRVLDPADALRALLDALGVAADDQPAGLDARAGLYRSLLAARRVLIMLDNARDVEQVRPLLPGTPSAVTVVTSRNRLMPLVAGFGAHLVDIDVLAVPESHELLRHRLGAEAVAAEAGAADRVVIACARLPLALAIAAARAQQTGLGTVAADLAEAGRRLDTLDAGDAASRVRTVFSWSYDTLDGGAARLFRLLGLHPGADITVPAAASLAGQPVTEVQRTLRELTGAGLLAESAGGRFSFHDLLREFARELAHTVDTEVDRQAAASGLLDHYVYVTYRTAGLLASRLHLPHPPDRAVPGTVPTDRDAAIDWFAAESDTVVACVHLAATAELDRQACFLADSLVELLDGQSRWRELETVQRIALASAIRVGDRVAEGHMRRGVAQALARTGRHEQALPELERALAIFTSLDDHRGTSLTHKNLSYVYEGLGRLPEALSHAEQCRHFAVLCADPAFEAGALNALGWMDVLHGDAEAGLARCQAALRLGRRHIPRIVPIVLDSVGHACLRLGRLDDAVASFAEAYSLHQTFNDRRGAATALLALGDAHHAAGDPDAARSAWQHALETFDELRHPQASTARARLCQREDAAENS